jgi:hypothetical protein
LTPREAERAVRRFQAALGAKAKILALIAFSVDMVPIR